MRAPDCKGGIGPGLADRHPPRGLFVEREQVVLLALATQQMVVSYVEMEFFKIPYSHYPDSTIHG